MKRTGGFNSRTEARRDIEGKVLDQAVVVLYNRLCLYDLVTTSSDGLPSLHRPCSQLILQVVDDVLDPDDRISS